MNSKTWRQITGFPKQIHSEDAAGRRKTMGMTRLLLQDSPPIYYADMQSRFSRFWYKATTIGIQSGLGRSLAKLWHTVMPSFPVKRRVFGLTMFFDSRDHPFAWYANRTILEQAENIPDILAKYQGSFWDAGANAGIYSLYMASRGNRVIAFELSPKAISYIERSARENGLSDKITTIPRAFSTEAFKYRMPESASAGNRISFNGETNAMAITYKEAAEKFGVPSVIKMDIEGHEEVFLKSLEFKAWLVKYKVGLIMELHRAEFWDLIWKDVRSEPLKDNVVLIQP